MGRDGVAGWDGVIAELRSAAAPRQDAALGRLHKLVLEDCRVMLASFGQLDAAVREDLAVDLLISQLEKILAADKPRTYFSVALRNRALDLLRTQKRAAAYARAEEHVDHDERADGDPDAVIDQRRVVLGLSARDKRIVTAVGLGEDREEIALAYGVSRAAIDQIVSRVRRRLSDKDEEEA